VCSECGGHGVKMTTRRVGPGFIQQFQTTCEKCHGKGKIYTSTCPVCGGRKVEMADLNFDVDLDKGTPDGFEVELENYADEVPGQPAGHVRLQVMTAPHPLFTREGDHLWMDMDISLRESLVGFNKTFTHLDGRRVEVVRDDVTPPRFVTVLKGEGMPKQHSPSERGQLHVKFHVQFPEALSDEQKVGFRELFSMK
jgi:DnaJ-related protein SCJ1